MNSRVLPIIAILLAVLIFFFYVRPTWNGPVADANAAIALDNDALASAKDYQKEQTDLTAKQNAIDPESLKRLAIFLPDSVDNVRLILDLNALAARSGVSLTNIDVSTNAAAQDPTAVGAHSDPTGSVSLSFSALGTYSSLQTFLTRVETSERLLDVQSVSIKGSDTGVYTLEMSIRLYWLR